MYFHIIILEKTKPFILGIRMSRTAKSYTLALNLDNANTGSVNVLTSNDPISSRISLKVITMSFSSSTTRILFFAIFDQVVGILNH
jgi:hypothetical protein